MAVLVHIHLDGPRCRRCCITIFCGTNPCVDICCGFIRLAMPDLPLPTTVLYHPSVGSETIVIYEILRDVLLGFPRIFGIRVACAT